MAKSNLTPSGLRRVLHSERKVVPIYSMKAYRGRKGTAPLILHLGNDDVYSTSRHGLFTQGKNPGTH